MRVFISLLMLLLINNYHSQDINKQIEGSWEVKKIDGKEKIEWKGFENQSNEGLTLEYLNAR